MFARAVARIMPIRASYWIAERVADIWYLTGPRIRANVAYNLSLLPGGPAGEREVAAHTQRTMRNFARVVAEFLYLPRFNPENIGRLVDMESFADLKRTMAGRPAILVTAHLGNWELAAVAIAMSGVDLHVVVYDHPDPRVARLFRRHRAAKGLKMMPVKQAGRSVIKVLRAASVGVVGDRDYSGHGTEATFLGVRVSVPSAYAGLALSMKVPVIAGFCIRHGDGKYRLTLQQTVYDPERDRMTQEEILEACLRIFEKGVENHTEQWYFFERVDRRWGDPEEVSGQEEMSHGQAT
jgi:KDO2-lipid IV(A) lauroyltransferase